MNDKDTQKYDNKGKGMKMKKVGWEQKGETGKKDEKRRRMCRTRRRKEERVPYKGRKEERQEAKTGFFSKQKPKDSHCKPDSD